MSEIHEDYVENSVKRSEELEEDTVVEHEGILEEGEITYEERVEGFNQALAGVMFAFKNYGEPGSQIIAATGNFNDENYAVVIAVNEMATNVIETLQERFVPDEERDTDTGDV